MEVVNPIIRADMPDPDLLRVGDTFYMVSTTMFYTPGAPILKSKDLCHWEMVSYVFDILEENERYRLENGRNAYGKGQWATSLARYKGRYYACFVSHDSGKTYIFSSEDIEKSGWERAEIGEVFHDMSFLFWEGRCFLVYGNGEIRIVELEPDLSGVRKDGLRRTLFETPKEGMRLRCEGCRALIRNGFIYLFFIDWPADSGRREVVFRSRSLEGPYEFRVLMDDDCGFPGHGVAQGTLVDTEAGDWYAMLFQDRGASGRIPFLMPVRWEEDWPLLGIKREKKEGGFLWRIPECFSVPFAPYPARPLVISDSFRHEENRLALPWQWNHNPIPSCWSFTKRPGWLRLTVGRTASGLKDARNTLTQRTMEPGCSCVVTLDSSGMKEGDYAGLCALQGRFGQVGIAVENGARYLLCIQKGEGGEETEYRQPLENAVVQLRIVFDYRNRIDQASFAFRIPEEEWQTAGKPLDMVFTLDMFVGYRIGIFCYGLQTSGGHADFRDFSVQEL